MSRWNIHAYQYECMRIFFEQLLAPLGRATAVLPDSRTIACFTPYAADTATLPYATHLYHQYIQLKDGDISLGNDPHSGGTQPADLTLALGFAPTHGAAATLLIGYRLALAPRLTVAPQEEGLRIPPMPLVTNGQLNHDLLTAIAGHPLAPLDLRERIEEAIKTLQRVHAQLHLAHQQKVFQIDSVDWKALFQDSLKWAQRLVHNLPEGETLTSLRLESGSELRLSLEIENGHVVFDFNGTSTDAEIQLTDLMTFSTCFAFLRSLLPVPLPINSGTFQVLDVRSPSNSMVSVKNPKRSVRSALDGVGAVAALAERAYGLISKNQQKAQSCFAAHSWQASFGSGPVFFETVPGGTGAKAGKSGETGHNPWLGPWHTQSSAEKIEDIYPLIVEGFSVHDSSGGNGRTRGGDGLSKTYRLLQKAQVSWAFEQFHHRIEGVEQGKSAQNSKIYVVHNPHQREPLETAQGTVSVAEGERVRILSGGGGGYGPHE